VFGDLDSGQRLYHPVKNPCFERFTHDCHLLVGDQVHLILQSLLRLCLVAQILAQFNPPLEDFGIFTDESQGKTYHFLHITSVQHFHQEFLVFCVLVHDLALLPDVILVLKNQSVPVGNRVEFGTQFDPHLGAFVVVLTVEFVNWFILVEGF